MTTTDLQRDYDNAAADASTRALRPPTVRVFRWVARRPELPWVAVAGLAVLLLALAGNPVTDAVIYGVYWLVAIVIPGVLLQRALVGSRSLPEDIGFGAVLGLAWQLIGWFVFTALQLQVLLWTWPVAIIVLFAVAPGLRRHWRTAERVPLAWSWGASASMMAAIGMLYLTWMRETALPPHTRVLEPDLWYHLSINAELTRTVFPDLPYVAGEPLKYHWFANAHMATGQLMTGIDPAPILLHLWLVPIVAVLFLLTCGLSRWLTRLWWPGVVAATLTVSFPVAIAISAINVGVALTPLVHASPSSVYASVVMLGLSRSVLQLVRKHSTPGAWIWLALLTLLAAGTKPTLLPLVLAGTVVAAAYLLVRRRPVKQLGFVLVALAAGLVASSVVVTGGTAGSELRLFGYFRLMPGFRPITGDDSVQGVTGGWVVPGVLNSGMAGWVLAFALVAALVLFHLPSLLGLVGTMIPRMRDDPAVWWLAGAVVASFGPLLIVDHMGGSQKYFLVSVFSLGMILTVHVFALHLPVRRGPIFRWSLMGVFLAGTVAVTASVGLFGTGGWENIRGAVGSLLVPVAMFCAMALAVVLLSRRLGGERARSRYAVVLAGALLLGWSVPHFLAMTVGQVVGASANSDPLIEVEGPRLAAPKQQAALWLVSRGHTDDVVVTNAHCFKTTRSRCDVRGFWVSALSGRRVYLEGWGYTPENARTREIPGLSYEFQPSPWPQRLRWSDASVQAPTVDLLDRLARDHGVRWVFADKTVARPAPRLHDLAVLRYENRDIAIFDLHPRERKQ